MNPQQNDSVRCAKQIAHVRLFCSVRNGATGAGGSNPLVKTEDPPPPPGGASRGNPSGGNPPPPVLTPPGGNPPPLPATVILVERRYPS